MVGEKLERPSLDPRPEAQQHVPGGEGVPEAAAHARHAARPLLERRAHALVQRDAHDARVERARAVAAAPRRPPPHDGSAVVGRGPLADRAQQVIAQHAREPSELRLAACKRLKVAGGVARAVVAPRPSVVAQNAGGREQRAILGHRLVQQRAHQDGREAHAQRARLRRLLPAGVVDDHESLPRPAAVGRRELPLADVALQSRHGRGAIEEVARAAERAGEAVRRQAARGLAHGEQSR